VVFVGQAWFESFCKPNYALVVSEKVTLEGQTKKVLDLFSGS
jgi:hypothetical protein